MNITGTCHMDAPRDVAWAAFHDQGVLERTIPGVKALTKTGEDAYSLAVTMGVASIKGTYEGDVALTQQEEPTSFVLVANGAGAPGTIGTTVRVRLADAADGGTDIAYDADAVVGGPIGGVGQRMLAGVAKRVAAQFFAAIDRDIARGGSTDGGEQASSGAAPEASRAPAAVEAPSGSDAAASAGATTDAATGAAGRAAVAAGPPPVPVAARPHDVPFWIVLSSVGAGAACTLAGVVVGWAVGRGGR